MRFNLDDPLLFSFHFITGLTDFQLYTAALCCNSHGESGKKIVIFPKGWIAGQNMKSRGITIEKKIEFLESLAGKVIFCIFFGSQFILLT